MKKLFGFILVVGILFSCSSEMESVQWDDSIPQKHSAKRSFSEALQTAQNAISLLEHGKSRGVAGRTVDLENVKYLCADVKSRSGGTDTLLYVFNYAENQGFAVVSANPNTEDLIAVVEEGSYNAVSDNIGFNMFMDMAENYVSTATVSELEDDSGMEELKEIIKVRDTTDVWIEPKLTVCWGQTDCEGMYAPNEISGCVNTALAQIMSYFEYPTQMNITYEDASISSLALNWGEIKKHKGVHDSYTCSADNSAHESIGHLLRQLGELTDSKYLDDGTNTSSEKAKNAMAKLGYTISTDLTDYANRSLLTELQEGNLVFMGGSRLKEDGTTVGHAWVVDGHFTREIHYTDWTKGAESGWIELLSEYYKYFYYNHINWGWDGDSNGYFSNTVFDSTQASQYDDLINYMNRNYTISLRFFSVKR